jgi:hypothetical protein
MKSFYDVHSVSGEGDRQPHFGHDHCMVDATAKPPHVAAGVWPAVIFIVLTLGLVGATAACVLVAGLGLGLGAPALLEAVIAGRLAARGPALAVLLGGSLLTLWLLHRAWAGFASARTRACADSMIEAIAVSLTLHALIFGLPWAG